MSGFFSHIPSKEKSKCNLKPASFRGSFAGAVKCFFCQVYGQNFQQEPQACLWVWPETAGALWPKGKCLWKLSLQQSCVHLQDFTFHGFWKFCFIMLIFLWLLLSGAGFDFYSDFSVVWQSEKFGIVVQHFISVLVSSLLCTASNIFKV